MSFPDRLPYTPDNTTYTTEVPEYEEPKSSSGSSRPYIHVKKVEINNHNTKNNITNINIPTKNPTADIIEAAAKFVISLTTAASTALMTFFWASRHFDVQTSFNDHVQSSFTTFQNALKEIIPQ